MYKIIVHCYEEAFSCQPHSSHVSYKEKLMMAFITLGWPLPPLLDGQLKPYNATFPMVR